MSPVQAIGSRAIADVAVAVRAVALPVAGGEGDGYAVLSRMWKVREGILARRAHQSNIIIPLLVIILLLQLLLHCTGPLCLHNHIIVAIVLLTNPSGRAERGSERG